jgi:hypothetical protein
LGNDRRKKKNTGFTLNNLKVTIGALHPIRSGITIEEQKFSMRSSFSKGRERGILRKLS